MSEAHIPLESLLRASNGSVYKLAILAAKRALQLADGEKALIDKIGERCLDNALKEIKDGKIKIKGIE